MFKRLINPSLYRTNVFFMLVVLLSACIPAHQEDNNIVSESYFLDKNMVVLPENSKIYPQLSFQTMVEQIVETELIAHGVVRAIPSTYAEIAPPFAGRIQKMHRHLGDKLTIGTPIFDLSSQDYFNVQKEYFDAIQSCKLAEQNYQRQQDLLQHGVGTQREWQEAQTEYFLQKSALENASSILKTFQVDPKKVVLGEPLTVRSPINGELILNNIVVGQYLKEDAPSVAIVADVSKVWVVAQIKEKDLFAVHKNNEVEITTNADPKKVFKGRIQHVGRIVNEETRSVEVFIECENRQFELKPGMYVRTIFKHQIENALCVPTTAISQNKDQQSVFVQLKNNRFERRSVQTSELSNGSLFVQSGLKANEQIVSNGAFLMNGK